jgi:transcriptional regulator with XRE-family HTH domain
MAAITFGQLLKELRQAAGLTLREFCEKNGFDAGNVSRMERGLFPPPQRSDLLERYALALGLRRGSDEWVQFCDVAAASRGSLPDDLLSDEELLGKLPVLFRTLRGSPVPSEKLDELIEQVRRG